MTFLSRRIRADWTTAVAASLLSVTVAVIHVLDQGGITGYAGSPWWLGQGYRLVELAALAIAVALLVGRQRLATWLLTALLAAGPFTMYLLTRGVGLPGDAEDKGKWNDPLGTTSLLVEGTLAITALLTVVLAARPAESTAVNRSVRETVRSAA